MHAGGIGDVQEPLAAGGGAQHDHHVEREQLAPGLVGRLVVQPALDHHVQPGVAEPGRQADHGPARGMDPHRMDQDGAGRERGEHGEHAHVTDPRDQPRREHRADQEPGEVAGHQDAGHGGREALERGADAEQRALQAVAQHHQRDAQEQRPAGPHYRHHSAVIPCRARSARYVAGRCPARPTHRQLEDWSRAAVARGPPSR